MYGSAKKAALNFADKSGEMTIFVLDDDRDVREALRAILGHAGYDVVCFADDRGLVEATAQRTPACIILDLQLPGKSGLDILKDFKDYPAPKIMISAHGNIATAVNAIKSGAFDFVEKPFTSDEIVRRVANVVRRATIEAVIALPKAKLAQLTLREGEVLERIATGMSSKQVGQALSISYRTVELHRTRLLRKLGFRSSTELLIGLSRWNRKPASDL